MKTIMAFSAVFEYLCVVREHHCLCVVIVSFVYCVMSGRAHMYVGGCAVITFYACVFVSVCVW